MPKERKIIGHLMGYPIYEVDDTTLNLEGDVRLGTLTKEVAERAARHMAADALAGETLVWIPGEGN